MHTNELLNRLESNLRTVADSWNGIEDLWIVFWVHNMLLGGIISYGIDSLEDQGLDPLSMIFTFFALVWSIWVTVALWRCAFNSKWRGWGYIVRTAIGLGITLVIVAIVNTVT